MNENMITGIVFNLDREVYNQLKQGIPEQRAIMQATQTIVIFRKDYSNHEVIDLSKYSTNAKETLISKLYRDAQKDGVLTNNQIASYFLQDNDYRFVEALATAINHQEFTSIDSLNSKAKKVAKSNIQKYGKKGAITLATMSLAAALTACGISAIHKDSEQDSIGKGNLSESQIKNEIPDFWLSYINTALSTQQKQLFVNHIAEWITSVNAQEDWEKVTLTEEQMKEYGYDEAESLYGFTAEDAYSLALRFGDYSKEDYLALTGGNEIDTVRIMDDAHSASNGALSRIIAYYINSNNCDLHIEKLINFNEAEQKKIAEFEELFREYHTLDNEKGKEKEAKSKMKEIKEALVNYAHDIDFEQDNAKSYILRTFAPAASAISQIHQYQDKIEVKLYDTKNDKETSKEITTQLFDEITMRTLVHGFNESEGIGAFDAESFLEEHNISKSRYNLLNTDVEESIANQSCGAQSQKLEEANRYITTMRSENYNAELAYAGGLGLDLSSINIDQLNNVRLPYDRATDGTYDPTSIMKLLDNYLKNNAIYPKNVDYFSKYKLSELSMEYKDSHGVTRGKPGDIVSTVVKTQEDVTSEQLTGSNTVVLNQAGQLSTAYQAMAEARQEDAKQSTEYDYTATTPEEEKKAEADAEQSQGAQERIAFLSGVYAATYNNYAGKVVISTNVAYNAAWASDSDAEVVYNYNLGMQDGTKWRIDEEQLKVNGGGTTIIDPEFKDAEISDKSEEQRQAEADRLAQEEAERQAEADRLAQEEAERQAEADRLAQEEAERQAEADRLAQEEAERQAEADRLAQEEANKDNVEYFDGFQDAEIDGDIIMDGFVPVEQNTLVGEWVASEPVNEAVSVSPVEFTSVDQLDSYIQQFNDLTDEEFMAMLDATNNMVSDNNQGIVKTK